jgi:hypothetical protein
MDHLQSHLHLDLYHLAPQSIIQTICPSFLNLKDGSSTIPKIHLCLLSRFTLVALKFYRQFIFKLISDVYQVTNQEHPFLAV